MDSGCPNSDKHNSWVGAISLSTLSAILNDGVRIYLMIMETAIENND